MYYSRYREKSEEVKLYRGESYRDRLNFGFQNLRRTI